MNAVRLEPLSAPWLAILTAATIAVDTRRVELRWIPPRLLERLVASECLSVRLAAVLLLRDAAFVSSGLNTTICVVCPLP